METNEKRSWEISAADVPTHLWGREMNFWPFGLFIIPRQGLMRGNRTGWDSELGDTRKSKREAHRQR